MEAYKCTKGGIAFLLVLIAVALMKLPTPTLSENLTTRPDLQKLALISVENSHARLQFIDSRRGWIADGKKLWRTSDGGLTWDLVYEGEADRDRSYIKQIDFISPKIGWMLVIPTGLYSTRDGGSTWMQQSLPVAASIYSIKFFKDGKRGWIAGEILRPPPKRHRNKTPRPDSYAVISYTGDGGRTWEQQIISSTRSIQHLYFLDEKHGWALGSPRLFYLDSNSNLWKEVDFYKGRCVNQMLLDTVKSSDVVHNPVAINFTNPTDGWLSFETGYMAKTVDGGKSWCDLLNPRVVWLDAGGVKNFWKIHFVDWLNGWAFGYDSSREVYDAIYETKNGGVTWDKLDINERFKDMYFLDAQHGWVLSNKGVYQIIN